LLYIESCANLIAETIGLQKVKDKAKIKKLVEEVKVPEFKPRQDVKIAVDAKEEEKKQEDNASADDFAILDELWKELDVTHIGVKSSDFHPADFEKDDDTNYHIDYIHAAA